MFEKKYFKKKILIAKVYNNINKCSTGADWMPVLRRYSAGTPPALSFGTGTVLDQYLFPILRQYCNNAANQYWTAFSFTILRQYCLVPLVLAQYRVYCKFPLGHLQKIETTKENKTLIWIHRKKHWKIAYFFPQVRNKRMNEGQIVMKIHGIFA